MYISPLILASILAAFIISACEESAERHNPERHWENCRNRVVNEFRCGWETFGHTIAFPWQMMWDN